MPSCREWWDSDTEGLRIRLLADTGLDSTANWRYLARRVFGSESTREAQDALLYGVLTMDAQLRSNRVTNAYPRDEGLGLATGNIKATAAVTWLALKTPELVTHIYVLKLAAPMFQATILCFVIAVLVLLHLISGYSLSTAITLLFVVGSIQFWSFIFAFCHWLDTSLWAGAINNNYAQSTLRALADFSLSTNFMIIDFLIGALYILLPILFTTLMAVAGHNVGSNIASASGADTKSLASQGAGLPGMLTPIKK